MMEYEILCREQVFQKMPTAMCHASTVLPRDDGGVIAAWFGGSYEGQPDTAIYMASRAPDGQWTEPTRVAGGGEAHWNPVLLDGDGGRIVLFFKVGAEIAHWKTMCTWSDDNGVTWSGPEELVPGDASGGRGPVRNKVLRLSGGRLVAPGSVEHGIWTAFVDRSDDGGRCWTKSNAITVEGLDCVPGERSALGSAIAVSEQSFHGRGVIQPTLWAAGGEVHMLLRSTEGRIYRSDSMDAGETWSPAYPTALPNNNSGIDLDRGADGTLYLVYNPVGGNWGPRTPLSLAFSTDNAKSWHNILDLETGEGEFSYPAIVARGDILHITYTWDRRSIAYWRIKIKRKGGQS